MSFQTGLSGLNAAAKNLDVIGNNVANSGTVGFKAARVEFSDVYANSLSGSGSSQIGIGTAIAAVSTQFTQGAISVTNNPLDVAINGQGFFQMSDDGAVSFSRNGQFHIDRDGFLANSAGLLTMGYAVSPTGTVVGAAPVPLQVQTADLAPQASGLVTMGVNLTATATPPTLPFDAANAETYNGSTSGTVFDSLGDAHAFTQYFVSTGAGTWDAHFAVDGGVVPFTQALTFDAFGALTSPVATVVLPAVATANGSAPLSLQVNLTQSTQYGSPFGVNTWTQDGYTSGRLTGVELDGTGTVLGRYSNGQTKAMGQLALANFVNPQGLKPLGGGQFAETYDSGTPLVGSPGTSSLGVLQAAAVEESTVDLTQELISMITAQRMYQANAQTIKTQDQIMQTLVNLR